MALRTSCHVPERVRRCCLSCCLTNDEMMLIRATDPFFEVLNVDTECQAQCCPCLFEERITKIEMAVLRAVTKKPMWGGAVEALGQSLTSALPGLFGGLLGGAAGGLATQVLGGLTGGGSGSGGGGGGSSNIQGLELTKRIVEELNKAAPGDDEELTKKQVREAVMAAVSSYSTGALRVVVDVIKEEYKAVGIANVEVRTGGAPANDEIAR